MSTSPAPAGGALNATEFDYAHEDFTRHFLVNCTKDVEATKQTFPHAALKELVSTIEGEYRLVVVHYGLDDTSMRYGFSIAKGTYNGGARAYDYTYQKDPTHMLVGGAFAPISEATWRPLRKAYFDTLMVQRSDASGATFEHLKADDALRAVLAWDAQLDLLYKENVIDREGPFRMAIDSVSMVHEAESEGGSTAPAGFRHGVAFYVEEDMKSVWQPLLSDPGGPSTYRDRGADYGNLCPIRCARYTEPG